MEAKPYVAKLQALVHAQTLKAKHDAEEQRLQQLEVDEAIAKIAESTRLRKEAEARTAESTRLRKEAEAKIAESTRLRKEAEAKTAEYTRIRKEAEAQIAEDRRIRKEVDEKIARQQRPLKVLPPIVKVGWGTTQPTVRRAEMPRKFNLVPSEMARLNDSDLEAIALNRNVPSALMSSELHDNLRYENENVVSQIMRFVLGDICKMLSLKADVLTEQYIKVDDNRNVKPYAMFLRAFDDVIQTLLDVKIPGDNVFSTEYNGFDQMYSYLVAFENQGSVMPMGILTTYEEWCFCWLDCAHELGTADSIDKIDKSFEDISKYSSQPTGARTMYYGRVKRENEQLINLLLSFVYKCFRVPQVAQTGMLWLQFLPDVYKRLSNHIRMDDGDKADIATPPVVMPEHVVDKDGSLQYDIYFVRTLGAGADGRAVLVFMVPICGDKSLSYWCVVKIFDRPNENEPLKYIYENESLEDSENEPLDDSENEPLDDSVSKAQKEARALSDAYPESASMYLTLCGFPAVLMPCRILLSESEFSDANTQALILNHVKELAMKGIMHDDLERRHVAWTDYEENDNRKICFIDWARVVEFTVESQQNENESNESESACVYGTYTSIDEVPVSEAQDKFITQALENAKKELEFDPPAEK